MVPLKIWKEPNFELAVDETKNRCYNSNVAKGKDSLHFWQKIH